MQYNFDWIEDIIKNYAPEHRKSENIRRCVEMIPTNIFWWSDLDSRKIYTHNHHEEIIDLDDYWKQRHSFEEKMIAKYSL